MKCFKCQQFGHIASQCPNQCIMIMLSDGEIIIEDETEYEGMPLLVEEDDSEEDILPLERFVGCFVMCKMLAAHVKDENEVAQHENIFYMHCHIKDKVCRFIIDGESYTNVASLLMVEKLGLPTMKHPKPYHLQWLNDGEVRVFKQVKVPFRIGHYEDEVVCDIVPMQASHVILGSPCSLIRTSTSRENQISTRSCISTRISHLSLLLLRKCRRIK